jgi:hypothetical protein
MTEFAFYLDAWYHCHKNKIPLNKIYRKDWKTWALK